MRGEGYRFHAYRNIPCRNHKYRNIGIFSVESNIMSGYRRQGTMGDMSVKGRSRVEGEGRRYRNQTYRNIQCRNQA